MVLERMHQLVIHDRVARTSVKKLLNQTTIGTEGTLYQLKDTAYKIDHLHNPHFFSLERNGNAIANITLCERNICVGKSILPSFYIRYFAFDKRFQGTGSESKGQSAFHHYFGALFQTSNLNPIQPLYNKSIYWAYIDPQNKRSAQMKNQFGFEPIGQLRTTCFSRFYPKKVSNVERLTSKADQAITRQAIQVFYKDYAFFSDIHLFEKDNYYILRKKGEIVAGIQANPTHWEIKRLPGKTGNFLVKHGHKIPLLKKIFNPKNHRFLATEGLFWTKGNELYVKELLEGVLALTGYFSLLIWEDTNSERINELPLRWGLIQQLKPSSLVDIVAKCIHFNSEEVEQLNQSKKYISGFDVT